MTVEDNIAYVLTISGQKNKKQNQKRVLELLNLVGLEESLLKTPPIGTVRWTAAACRYCKSFGCKT